MYSYALLEPGCYYLVQEKENDKLTLLQVKVISDHCMYVEKYTETVLQEWKRKTDAIFDIIELLSDDAVKEWTSAYYKNEDAYYEEDDDE
ncbi:MAG TPA: hypothetical protein VEV62_06165 [Parafilimonas sp.]|nr:hypothetical protein [Parafilimonas sp.]